MTEETKEKILKAALTEFAGKGFAGAGVEAIAKRAGVNKAMIFYYFSTKKNLYKQIIQRVLSRLFAQIYSIITPDLTPKAFFESMPRIYIEFFSQHPDLIKIIGFDLLQNPKNIASAINEIVRNPDIKIPKPFIWNLIHKWHEQGAISEADPMHVMMNIISLSVFSFIGLPMIENMTGEKIDRNHEFIQKRIQSVIHVLKKGMLT